MIFQAKDYNNRQELEAEVASKFGLTADTKPDHTIKGTKLELQKLFLGHGGIFWGIKILETDFVKPAKFVRVNRGKVYKTKLSKVDIEGSEER